MSYMLTKRAAVCMYVVYSIINAAYYRLCYYTCSRAFYSTTHLLAAMQSASVRPVQLGVQYACLLLQLLATCTDRDEVFKFTKMGLYRRETQLGPLQCTYLQ
jgi:hypothetical protein